MDEKKRVRTDASRKADIEYNKKRLNFALGYTTADIQEGKRLKAYLDSTNQSANSYIKSLVKADLDNKEIPYTD